MKEVLMKVSKLKVGMSFVSFKKLSLTFSLWVSRFPGTFQGCR